MDDSLVSHSLSSVAANVSLGDTNIAVPGSVDAYIEAGASEYIFDTVRYGYKLFFKDDIPPPKYFRQTNFSLGRISSFGAARVH